MSYAAPSYPTAIPDRTDIREVVDDVDDILAQDHNDPAAELIAALTELGTLPKGSAADVKTRLAISLNNDGSLKPSSMWTSAPSAANDTGIPGEQAYDTQYHYICQDTDTWLRASIVTW